MFPVLRRCFTRFKVYRVARAIYWRLPQIVKEAEQGDSEVTSLLPERPPRGAVLLSHIRGDFLINQQQQAADIELCVIADTDGMAVAGELENLRSP